ncbi:MAG: ATP-dependent 6-phosphofructokinase [Gemmatimonadota bacterium]|nr:ATP-dependent 6-phosphofructokinase [Gemmatimonadota bacterium]
MLKKEDFKVKTLGQCRYDSPLDLSDKPDNGLPNYSPEGAEVPYQVIRNPGQEIDPELAFEKAGPREKLFFDPQNVYAAIVTCGGLCPGLNNVIQSIFLELHHRYGVGKVLGVRYGYQGFDPKVGLEPFRMTPEFVDELQSAGGSVLGCSRGGVPPEVVVDTLERWKVDMLFIIGGDGTLKGANEIAEEALRRGLRLAVVGIPKTIDNDILYVYRTFGFATAVDEARNVLLCAHNEAKGAPNGIGIVKIMGRDSGFIACYATLASMVSNLTLIPEIPFRLEGEGGILPMLEERILDRGHAVVVVAEGAGLEHLTDGEMKYDASGNVMYSQMSKDIGVFLRDRVKGYFKDKDIPVNVKYIDPSYLIRSVPANGADSLFCNDLARNAVHAAMAGKTDMVIGFWHNVLTHVPLATVTTGKSKVSPSSKLWHSVTEATGQPLRFIEE